MLRTVVQVSSRSLVRLRPGVRPTVRCAAPFSFVFTRDDTAHAASHGFTPRCCFSAAPTQTPEAVAEETKENSKKKQHKKKKVKQRPSQAKALDLFDEIAHHISLKALVGARKKLEKAVENMEATATRVGQVHALLDAIDTPKYIKQRLKEFLLMKRTQELKDCPVTINKEKWEENVALLEQARDLSAQKPLLWSIAQRKKIKRKAQESQDSSDKPSVLSIHQSKSEQVRRKEAEELATILAEKLPEKAHTELMQVIHVYVNESTNPNKPKLRMLYSHLEKCATSHVHLVAFDVANFFYVDHNTGDPRLNQYEKQWEAARQEFADALLRVYDALDKVQSENSSLLATTLKEQNAETLGELDRLRTRPSDGIKIGRDRGEEKGKDGRRQKHVHLVFDAIVLQDQWKPLSSDAPLSDKMVFIDNLPVDMEESDLLDLYSRCGPIQSVKIFNRRGDLDPGPRTAKQRKEQRLNQRLKGNRRRWKRPRTPVYGIVTFSSQEGYASALDAPMRIFGMVVRKHPMRSIQPADMTRLYLEDIPEGMYSLDIEHKLSELLHPEIYVCLDVGQHDYAEPLSCEIKFPTFEMAYHAYHKLYNLDIEGSTLNWMRTPEDAMKYWTREYTFDT